MNNKNPNAVALGRLSGLKGGKMREIKFRAWHCRFKEWHYYDLVSLVSMEKVEQIANSKYFYAKFLDYENWCEYTGLKDKNGKEIYEGDIVKSSFRPPKEKPIYEVKWIQKYAEFSIQEAGVCKDCVEIIGNIWENPELLNN